MVISLIPSCISPPTYLPTYLQAATAGEIMLPASMPRLEKSFILDKESAMEFSWSVGPKNDYVDIQVGR